MIDGEHDILADVISNAVSAIPAKMTSPHIRRLEGRWHCKSPGSYKTGYVGATPDEAYAAWKSYSADFRMDTYFAAASERQRIADEAERASVLARYVWSTIR